MGTDLPQVGGNGDLGVAGACFRGKLRGFGEVHEMGNSTIFHSSARLPPFNKSVSIQVAHRFHATRVRWLLDSTIASLLRLRPGSRENRPLYDQDWRKNREDQSTRVYSQCKRCSAELWIFMNWGVYMII